jgi:hypothetical protein
MNRMTGSAWTRGFLGAVLVLLLTGCVSHIQTVQKAKNQLAMAGHADTTGFDKDAQEGDKDEVWAHMERGRLKQLQGDWAGSSRDYEAAVSAFQKRDEKALISVSDTASKGAAVLVNDLMLPYEGEAYERLMVFQLDAFNRAAMGKMDEIGVDVRNIASELQKALEAHEKEAQALLNDKDGQEKTSKTLESAPYRKMMDDLAALAGENANSFQNAYTYGLAGVWYESRGLWSDAFIAYGRAHKLCSGNNRAFREGILLSAVKLGKRGRAHANWKGPRPGEGSVVVFLEQGYNVEKRPFAFPIILPKNFVQVALPYYDCSLDTVVPSCGTIIGGGGNTLAETDLACDFRILAVRALRERMPGIVTRQILRSIAKAVINEQAQKVGSRAGGVGQLIGMAVKVGNAMTEQPDLRSWRLLPRFAQTARFHLPEGEHDLDVSVGAQRTTVHVTVRAGRPTLLHVMSVPGVLRATATAL